MGEKIILTEQQEIDRNNQRKQAFATDLLALEKKHNIKLQIQSNFVLVFNSEENNEKE